ncbi:MAG TPA: DUF456 domain-containing protein [Firmicutes bacterium]|nr:DUF456 domain-containing protein [Bacillota bacterium]
MVEAFWWIVIVVCFVLGLAGIVLPILPSVALVWVGVAMYHFFIDAQILSWVTWATMVFFTAIILIVDQLSNVVVVKRYGASKISTIASLVGAFVGIFVFPPFGVVLVPFFLVFILELLQNRPLDKAFNIAFGTIIAFVGSTFAKGLMQIIMMAAFFIDVFWL